MEDASTGYKVSIPFILMSVLFVTAIVIIAPLVSSVQKIDKTSVRIVIRSGLIYKLGESLPYSGQIIDTLESKVIKYNVMNGLKHGEFSISTLEGNFSVCGFVENNKNVGNWKYFYDNGSLESVGSFTDDRPHGNWIWYYKSGKVKSEGNYLLGKAEGRWTKYDERGNLNLMIYYSNGEIVSEVKISLPKSV
jgi:antitoxin component YwqK of YwqJK toxin-antitoxin module